MKTSTLNVSGVAPAKGTASAGEWRTGWGVVLSAAIGVALVGFYTHFIGTMIRPFAAAYGWGRGEVALGLTIISFIAPLSNLLAGLLADRYGGRRVVLWGVLGWALSFALLGLAGPALWTWYAACALFAVAHVGASAVVWTSLVVRRFTRQRGLALALSLVGGGLMVAITPTLSNFLVAQVGVRGTFFVIAAAGWALMSLPAWLFFHEQPAGRTVAAPPLPELAGLTLRQALATRRFWQLGVALLLVAGAVGTFLVHSQPILSDAGLSQASAASVAFFIGPSLILGRLFTGFMFDRCDPRAIAAAAFALPAVACLLLLNLHDGYAWAAAAGIVIGLGAGAEIDVVSYLTARYFGRRHYGKLYALLVSLYQIGFSLGSLMAGTAFDRFKTYEPLLLGLAAASLLAAVMMALMGRPPAGEARD